MVLSVGPPDVELHRASIRDGGRLSGLHFPTEACVVDRHALDRVVVEDPLLGAAR